MPNRKMLRKRRCKNCGRALNAIWFTALMTEEWSWNGQGYDECTARHSLATDPQQPVLCPKCGEVVGIGQDFGFGDPHCKRNTHE